MKLHEFRLETYDERFTLMCALDALSLARRQDKFFKQYHAPALEALKLRLSRTQCQPGGCEYCSGKETPNGQD